MQPRYLKPKGCYGCSLERNGFGFAIPSGPVGARLTFIGESLGYEEAIHGEPFYGGAGGVLSRILHRAGIHRPHVRIANVVSCRPPGDYLVGAPWEEAAIAQCRQYLQPVLDSVPENGVVVPLGATALGAILGLRGVEGVSVKDFHGTVNRDPTNRFWVVPTFHPSHLQRGAMNLLEIVTNDVRVAKTVSERGFVRSPAELVVDPHPDYVQQFIAGHLALMEQQPDNAHLALDTEFVEKAGGVDEGEVTIWDARSPMTRVNLANSGGLGLTFPYREPYIGLLEGLLQAVAARQGWLWLWNKYADLDHLAAAGHTVTGIEAIDAMWLWHHIQSDVPRGLGFVAPLASDFGPWKHWGKQKDQEGPYAAADALQTWRTSMWLLRAAHQYGLWEVFERDWHERDTYVLRPAHVQGVPINRPALEAFHAELQGKLGSVLGRIKATAAQGVLKPKLGYKRKPKRETPPQSIFGAKRKSTNGNEAKQQYMSEGVRLVEKEIEVEVQVCDTCGRIEVGAKHRCALPSKGRSNRKQVSAEGRTPRPVARLRHERRAVTRYFWQLPFNPDAPAQVLAYLSSQGIDAPVDKKRGTATTNKKALEALSKQHRDDPFFQLQLDYRAVQKVDSTYAVGTLNRLDADDRVHPEYMPKPSTLRDSAVNPNLTNVVADKAGPAGLASGFRRAIEARDGVPPGVTEEELAQWQSKWTTAR